MEQRKREELLSIVSSDEPMAYLRKRMEQVGVSASRLARQMSRDEDYSVADETLRRWLRGENDPQLTDLRRIAEALVELEARLDPKVGLVA